MGGDVHRTYEIRCPVYGFVKLSDWEWQIISERAYQRLRRIRQLAWTDYVFPGAMHTRFEHSLGVMHMATMLYDGIAERSRDVLQSQLGYNEDGIKRHRTLVRLAALLHDVGHSPFSHAAEELFPVQNTESKERYKHEQYSAAIVRRYFADVIKNHPLNTNYDFSADDIANLLEGAPEIRQGAVLARPHLWSIGCGSHGLPAPGLVAFRGRVRPLRLAATCPYDRRGARDARGQPPCRHPRGRLARG